MRFFVLIEIRFGFLPAVTDASIDPYLLSAMEPLLCGTNIYPLVIPLLVRFPETPPTIELREREIMLWLPVCGLVRIGL